MAREIIIMERQPADWPGATRISAVFWIPVTAGQESPLPVFVSAIVGSDAPDTNELAALRTGSVREFVVQYTFPDNYSSASIRTFLEACWTRCSANFVPPGTYYGAKWDGTTWTA